MRQQGNIATQQEGPCIWHDARGIKCAVGKLIPEHMYEPEMAEETNVDDLMHYFPTVGKLFKGIDQGMLREMQLLHDNYGVDQWEYAFGEIADEYNLNVPPI